MGNRVDSLEPRAGDTNLGATAPHAHACARSVSRVASPLVRCCCFVPGGGGDPGTCGVWARAAASPLPERALSEPAAPWRAQVAVPSLGFAGYDGVDWDLEGNDNQANAANHFTLPGMALVGEMSQARCRCPAPHWHARAPYPS